MQQYTVFLSCAKYLYITERERHVCLTQDRKYKYTDCTI